MHQRETIRDPFRVGLSRQPFAQAAERYLRRVRRRVHHRDDHSWLQTINSDFSFFVRKILWSAYRQEQDINMSNIDGLGWGDGVFDCSEVAEAKPVHSPNISNI